MKVNNIIVYLLVWWKKLGEINIVYFDLIGK